MNLNAKVKALSNFSSRPSKSGPGNTKSMNVELQIEVTEDAAQHLTPDIIRSAFRMSLCDDLDYTAVHKVLVEEEYVKQKDKNGKDIEILTAVPRVESHPEWLQKFSEGPSKDEISNRNPPAPLNRATPKAATKAREAREAAAKQQNQAPPNIRGGKPGMGQGGRGGRGRGLGRGGGFAGVARGGA